MCTIQCEHKYYVPFICWKLRLTYFFKNQSFGSHEKFIYHLKNIFSPRAFMKALGENMFLRWEIHFTSNLERMFPVAIFEILLLTLHEVNCWKVRDAHSWLTSYHSFGARNKKLIHYVNGQDLDEQCCQVTRSHVINCKRR